MIFLKYQRRKKMKSKTLKSVMTIAVCVALILLAGFVLTACGDKETAPTYNIYATDKAIPFGTQTIEGEGDEEPTEVDVMWENTDDFALALIEGNDFKATGTPGQMSAIQATAWGTTEGSYYVIVSVKMDLESSLKTGWVTVEDKNVAFDDEHPTKTYAGTEGVKEYVLGISGSNIDHTAAPVWRIEVTSPAEGAEMVAYTIDFTDMLAAINA